MSATPEQVDAAVGEAVAHLESAEDDAAIDAARVALQPLAGQFTDTHKATLEKAGTAARHRVEVATARAEGFRAGSITWRAVGRVIALCEERKAAAELSRVTAYNDGFHLGHEDGHARGVRNGMTAGTRQGAKEGHAQGYRDGYTDGRLGMVRTDDGRGFVTCPVCEKPCPVSDSEAHQIGRFSDLLLISHCAGQHHHPIDLRPERHLPTPPPAPGTRIEQLREEIR